MRKTKQPVGLKEGIYFKLSNDDYHADPALGHSGMTKVLISWADYWATGPLNPQRKKFLPTDAMIFSDRCHSFLLEGDKKFFQRFAVHGMARDTGKQTYIARDEFRKIEDSIKAILENPEAAEYFKLGYPEVSVFWRDPTTGIMLKARYDYLRTFMFLDYKRIKGLDNYTIGKSVRDQGLDIQCAHFSEASRPYAAC